MSLKETFNIVKKNKKIVADYNVFQDKKLLEEIRNKVVNSIINNNISSYDSINDFVREQINKVVDEYNLTGSELNYVTNMIESEFTSYGPLTSVMEDPNIDQITINGPNEVLIGDKIDNNISFINNEHIIRTIDKMIYPLGMVIGKNNLMIDVNLKDGTKLVGVFPPLSSNISVVIKKRSRKIESLDELLRNGSYTPYMARFLESCMLAKANILIIGNQESGRTTMLNALLNSTNKSKVVLDNNYEVNDPNSVVIDTRNKDNSIIDTLLKLNKDYFVINDITNEQLPKYKELLTLKEDGIVASLYVKDIDELINKFSINDNDIYYYLNKIDVIITLNNSLNKRRVVNISEVNKNKFKTIFEYKNDEFILYDIKPKIYKKIKNSNMNNIKDIFE